jgi:uncharacterized flavoprotein (TIGR03862 family)
MSQPSVAVVGGGPAGLAAAEVLGGAGVAVTVFERMPTVGRKLLVAGRSGLNLTHTEPTSQLLERYGPAAPRLAAAVAAFDADRLRAWAEGLGIATFVGSSGRVFPEGLRATPLLRAWLRRLDELGVVVATRHRWTGWDAAGALTFEGRPPMTADACVLALGGASWPRTGSDGTWVDPLVAAGVEVRPLRPANAGWDVAWTDVFRQRFAGRPVKDVVLRHGGASSRGDPVITDDGLEGGPVYALGAAVRATLDGGGPAVVELDAFPDATGEEVLARLQRRRSRDSVASGLTRAGIPPVVVGLLREATANQVPTDPQALAGLLRALPIAVRATQPLARAISTAGGVALDAVDGAYMLTARPGTFVAGEMLDWEAPTGGYLLQASFSTGVAAAEGALAWLRAAGPTVAP